MRDRVLHAWECAWLDMRDGVTRACVNKINNVNRLLLIEWKLSPPCRLTVAYKPYLSRIT